MRFLAELWGEGGVARMDGQKVLISGIDPSRVPYWRERKEEVRWELWMEGKRQALLAEVAVYRQRPGLGDLCDELTATVDSLYREFGRGEWHQGRIRYEATVQGLVRQMQQRVKPWLMLEDEQLFSEATRVLVREAAAARIEAAFA